MLPNVFKRKQRRATVLMLESLVQLAVSVLLYDFLICFMIF